MQMNEDEWEKIDINKYLKAYKSLKSDLPKLVDWNSAMARFLHDLQITNQKNWIPKSRL
jgi:hypothetical protein